MAIETAIFVFLAILTIVFFYGLLRVTYNMAGAGIDIMEFFGNIGRAGTSREQKMGDYKKSNAKWGNDGSKEI